AAALGHAFCTGEGPTDRIVKFGVAAAGDQEGSIGQQNGWTACTTPSPAPGNGECVGQGVIQFCVTARTTVVTGIIHHHQNLAAGEQVCPDRNLRGICPCCAHKGERSCSRIVEFRSLTSAGEEYFSAREQGGYATVAEAPRGSECPGRWIVQFRAGDQDP